MTAITGRRTFIPDFKAQVFARWRVECLECAPEIFAPEPNRDGEQSRIAELERMVGRVIIKSNLTKKPRAPLIFSRPMATRNRDVCHSLLRRKAIELGVKPETILDLPNGCNVHGLRPAPRAAARSVLGWPDDVLVIGHIGAIFQRDALLMAQAFDRIQQAEPKARLLLAGYCNVAVEKLVAAPNDIWRSGRIRYHEIGRYLAACDVLWLPLRDSGANRGRSPLKLNDYMSVGRPVVTTAVGDAADLVIRGEFGLVAADRPEDLAQQVLTLLRDPIRREAMGHRARQMAEHELAWDHIGEKLDRFYQQILDRARS